MLFQDIATSLNIPTVVELANVYPFKQLVPTVFVAPSHYAAQHDSVQEILYSSLSSMTGNDNLITTKKQPKVVVISPSVDVSKFNKTKVNESTQKYIHHTFNPHKSCVFTRINRHAYSRTETGNSNGLKQQEEMEQPSRQTRPSSDCIHIGYVGRLDADKNPGLFLQFAYTLLHDYYPLARFTIIGMLYCPVKSCFNKCEFLVSADFIYS